MSDGKLILAVIDKELKGKEIEEGNKVLDLKSDFYNGEEKSGEEVLKLAEFATQINAVGTNIVNMLKEKELIEKSLTIGGIPYAQTIIVRD